MFCRNCGKEVNPKAIACPACGVPPWAENKYCQECGTETSPKQIICVKCGVGLANGSGFGEALTKFSSTISGAGFGMILLMFLLPFVTFQFTEVQLVVGQKMADVPQSFMGQNLNVPNSVRGQVREVSLVVVFVVAIFGLIASLVFPGKSKQSFAALAAWIAFAGLIVFPMRVAGALSEANGVIQAGYQLGYYLALITAGVLSVFFVYQISISKEKYLDFGDVLGEMGKLASRIGPRKIGLALLAGLVCFVWLTEGQLFEEIFREVVRYGCFMGRNLWAAKSSGGIEWVSIPGGNFTMGSGNGDEGPAHSVTVKSFQMAKTLVTFGQYKKCVAAGACAAAHVSDGTCYIWNGSQVVQGTLPYYFQGDDQPVVCVDWGQAQAFSKWAGGRLPTEAEWEYAARSGGKEQKYPWGDAEATCDRAVISAGGSAGCGRNATWPVCSKPAGNTQQGLCDMAGNAWEWVQDWYHDSYNGAPTDGSAWESPTGSYRVIRGGSWNGGADYARSAYRSFNDPGYRGIYLGFRPARRGQ